MIHAFPPGDGIGHDLDTTQGCVCGPVVEYLDPADGTRYPAGPLVIHRSLDGREFSEDDTLAMVLPQARYRARVSRTGIVPHLLRLSEPHGVTLYSFAVGTYIGPWTPSRARSLVGLLLEPLASRRYAALVRRHEKAYHSNTDRTST